MNQAIRNALDDLETAAAEVNTRGDHFEADMIRESVETIRADLGNNQDKEDYQGN